MFLLLITLLEVVSPARAADSVGAAERWRMDIWTTRDGLPQNSVTDLVQARDGLVWMTTSGGIARFDGVEFQTLHSADMPGLDAARFSALVETPDGALWFGSEENGVYRYIDGDVRRVGDAMAVRDLVVDQGGVVWAGTSDGVARLTAGGAALQAVPGGVAHLAVLRDASVVGIRADGSLLCASGPCGGLPPRSAGGAWSSFDQDAKGVFWSGTPDGMSRWSGVAWEPLGGAYGQGFRPTAFVEWRGEAWYGHGTTLASGESPAGIDLLTVASGLEVNGPVLSLMVDREDGLWVGLSGGGVVRLQARGARLYGPRDAEVSSVAITDAGDVWASGCGLLLVVGDGAAPSFPGRVCESFWGDSHGAVLLEQREGLGAGGAVDRVAADGQRERVFATADWPDQGIRQPAVGPWFALGGVLYRVPAGGVAQPVIAAAALGGRELHPVHSVDDDRVWLVVDASELVLVEFGRPTRTVVLDGGAVVRDVLPRGDRLWVATYGGGLLAIEGDRVLQTLTPDRGMCDYALSRIFDSGDGALWFSTNRGLGRVLEAELEAVLAGAAEQVSCTIVDSGEANGRGGVADPGGRLWVPTVGGLAEVDPRAPITVLEPMLVLERASYDGSDLLRGGSTVVGPGVLRAQFYGLQFRDPRAIRYRYRLVGLDDRWSAPTRSREVVFENLGPGAYRLEIAARGLGGGWSEPVRLDIVRAPAWAETAAVRVGIPLLLALLVAGGLALGWRGAQRRNRLLRHEIAERERAEQRLEVQRAENERVGRLLEAHRRLEALGRLAGGVAHDFNNMLTVVSAHASLLTEHEDPSVREDGESLLSLVDRASALTRRLLVFGRQEPAAPEITEVGDAVGRLVPLLRRVIREDIHLELSIRGQCGVRIEPGRLDQIVSNLVLNARDAINGPGTIWLVVRSRTDPDSARKVVVEVRDDGAGLEPSTAAQIFEPYFTTKTLGRGTGLGLATVHGAVTDASGTIEVQSLPGQGTTFKVVLPLVEVEELQGAQVVRTPEVGPIRLLLVDDQVDVRAALVQVARSLGMRVLAAGSLTEAVAVASANPLDLLLTDVVMPGGNGDLVRDAVLALQPGIPVLFMSGHTDGVLDGLVGQRLLRKPFTRDQLARAVLEACDGAPLAGEGAERRATSDGG